MIVAIAANSEQKVALLLKGFDKKVALIWVNTSEELYQQPDADLLIDCLFNESNILKCNKPLLVHSPIHTLASLHASEKVARFCGWNCFLERSVWEVAVMQAGEAEWLQHLMASLGWAYHLVKDEPGLVAPRVISMIINEACFAFEDGVSSKAEINTAMKLGTNYLYGPFEWAEIIGIDNIRLLLTKLSESDTRYAPSVLLCR